MQENQEIIPDLDFAKLHFEDSSYNKLEPEEQNLSFINNIYIDQKQPRNYYCYRHRPDLVKERMADELELKKVLIVKVYLTIHLFNSNFLTLLFEYFFNL